MKKKKRNVFWKVFSSVFFGVFLPAGAHLRWNEGRSRGLEPAEWTPPLPLPPGTSFTVIRGEVGSTHTSKFRNQPDQEEAKRLKKLGGEIDTCERLRGRRKQLANPSSGICQRAHTPACAAGSLLPAWRTSLMVVPVITSDRSDKIPAVLEEFGESPGERQRSVGSFRSWGGNKQRFP